MRARRRADPQSKFEDDETVMSDGSALAIADALSMKRKELNEAARVLGVDPAIFPVL
jgi:LmbE family N-acetylglucosaminyl deacetylase